MNTSHDLEKSIWTDKDFETMGWHDNSIRAIAFMDEPSDTPNLALDIDYITEWLSPTPPSEYFDFYIAPATLIFDNVYKFKIDIHSLGSTLSIDDISFKNQEPPHENSEMKIWLIQCHEGEIKFLSTGFTQYMRQQPIRNEGQYLEMDKRGGLSFERKAY